MKIKALLFAIAAAFLALAPAQAQQVGAVYCSQSATYDASTNGATRLVANSSNRAIYICGYQITWGAAATGNVTLEYGTGTNCATDETAITPAVQGVAQFKVEDNSPVWRGLTVPVAKDFCLKTSAGIAIQAIIYYTLQ